MRALSDHKAPIESIGNMDCVGTKTLWLHCPNTAPFGCNEPRSQSWDMSQQSKGVAQTIAIDPPPSAFEVSDLQKCFKPATFRQRAWNIVQRPYSGRKII